MYTSSKSIVHLSITLILCNSKFGCASSFSPILPSSTHAFAARTAKRPPNKRINPDNSDVVKNHHIDIPKTRREYSATDVALSLSGGAVAAASSSTAAAIDVVGGLGPFSFLLAGLNSFYMSYPLLSAVTTCSVKGCLADYIAQRRNSAEEAGSDNDESSSAKAKSNKPKFSFRRNAAYILYGGGILGVFCDVMYNFVYPFLFGGMGGIINLVAVVVFDNMITAPLLWLPPVYFVKAILYGESLKSGIQKYWNDVKQNGLLTQYWKIWFPAQIVNFSLVPAHLRIAFMAGISFFWIILLSCISSNNKKTN